MASYASMATASTLSTNCHRATFPSQENCCKCSPRNVVSPHKKLVVQQILRNKVQNQTCLCPLARWDMAWRSDVCGQLRAHTEPCGGDINNLLLTSYNCAQHTKPALLHNGMCTIMLWMGENGSACQNQMVKKSGIRFVRQNYNQKYGC